MIEGEDGRILIAERPVGKFMAGWWEFPGGKLEFGERPEDGLAREVREELGIEIEVGAERAMTRHLQGSCQVPIAAFCIETEIGLHLSGLVGDAASGKLIRAEDDGQSEAPDALGERVARKLLKLGAGKLLGR